MDRRVRIDLDAGRRAREGDREAFALLVAQTLSPLRAFLARQLRDRDEVDDLAQDVYVRAWTKIAELRDGEKVAGWLWRRLGCRRRNGRLYSDARLPRQSINDMIP